MLYSSGFGNQPGFPVLGACVEPGLHGREHGAGESYSPVAAGKKREKREGTRVSTSSVKACLV